MQIQIVYERQNCFLVQNNGEPHTCPAADDSSKTKKFVSVEVINRIQNLFRSGTRMPKQVQKVLRNDHARGEIQYQTEPTINQIRYQVKKYKEEVLGKGEISLGELQSFLKDNSTVPLDIDEPFVLGFKVKLPKKKLLEISSDEDTDYDEEEEEDNADQDAESDYEVLSFWFLFSTVRLLLLLKSINLLAADSTFKLVQQGFSGILIGTVDMKKQFHKICFGMTTSEKTEDWAEMLEVKLICFFKFYDIVQREYSS